MYRIQPYVPLKWDLLCTFINMYNKDVSLEQNIARGSVVVLYGFECWNCNLEIPGANVCYKLF